MTDIKKETPAEVEAQIDDIKAKIANPATPPAHRSFLNAILHVLLKFLPIVIEMFHLSTGTASGSIAIPGVDGQPSVPINAELQQDINVGKQL